MSTPKDCPTPKKRSYATGSSAVWFAQADGLRAYRCRCGAWHLSSKPKVGARMGVSRRRHSTREGA